MSEKRKITVFGSHTVKVQADIAVISFSIWEKGQDPKKVAATVLGKSDKIYKEMAYRKNIKISVTPVNLKKKIEKVSGEHTIIRSYYYSTITYTIVTSDIGEVMAIQQAAIERGATDIGQTSFQISKLKAYRAAARKQAIRAARRKAELYCHELDAKVGRPHSIIDKNPDYFEYNKGRSSHYDMVGDTAEGDNDLVTVSGTVEVEFEIE